MANVVANQEREMRVAVERVVGFAQEFGEAHLNLACHAAFPLSLTPDLLCQIWANFVPEAPWTAVARVLLSRLCKQVGSEIYEMDNSVRNLLLRELKVQFGQERFESLGEFLLEYVEQRLTEDDADTQDLRQAQEWTALAYTKPEQAARELARLLSDKVQQEDIGEVLRLSSLVETLSEPLVEGGFEPLLVYGKGMRSYVCGDLKLAKKQLEEVFSQKDQLTIAGIKPYLPEELLPAKEDLTIFHKASEYGLEMVDNARTEMGWENLDRSWIRIANITRETLINFWQQREIPERDFIEICYAVGIEDWEEVIRESGHFSTVRTKFSSTSILLKSLRDLGFSVKTNADVRGSGGQRLRADVVVVLEGEYDIGFSENDNGSYDLIADIRGVARKHNLTTLINSIYQKYAVNKTLAEVKSRGLSQFGKKKCPRCDSVQTSRYGYFQKKQNYKCHNCGTEFTITDSTL
jgi:hypothetical protein